MPRANRHFLPGCVWHLTHRCHRADTQPLISVEDFWGGVFVGFVAGYLGSSVLSQVLPTVPAGGAIPQAGR
jgi:hypothetical protein